MAFARPASGVLTDPGPRAQGCCRRANTDQHRQLQGRCVDLALGTRRNLKISHCLAYVTYWGVCVHVCARERMYTQLVCAWGVVCALCGCVHMFMNAHVSVCMWVQMLPTCVCTCVCTRGGSKVYSLFTCKLRIVFCPWSACIS